MTLRLAHILLLAGAFAVATPHLPPDAPWGLAWADDDDDGDDGDGGGDDSDDGDDDSDDDRGDRDDDDDDSRRAGAGRDDGDDDSRRRARPGNGGSFLDRLFGRPAPAPSARRAAPTQAPGPAPTPAPAPPPPVSASDEIVALSLNAADLSTLTDQGFEVIEELAVPGLQATPRRLRIPAGTTLAEARARVRALPTGQDADVNHYYRAEQGFAADCRALECPIRRIIDWPEPADRAGGCGGGVPIGMVDTGINDGHATFDGADLEVLRLAPDDFTPSRALHGTAIAALLVGDPATRAPGLVPSAPLVAVDAFHRRGADERADVFTLIEALGLLAAREVGVINLSLSGPANTVLEEVVTRLTAERDIVLVAAVGNDGPRAAPAYPAAYAPVIAVTAVDRDRAVYRRAIRGAHVDLAAPGVAVWTAASIRGARWKTGTSYAVPFVTATAAILREARPDLTAAEVGPALARRAADLGDPGRDPVFGAGLLGLGTLCDGPA